MDKILVIDDEIRSLETIARTLDEEFEVLTCDNAKGAFDLLESNAVCAILCDQRMPDIEGVALLCDVRVKWPDIPRIMISGFTDAKNMIDAINKAGIYHYITKPWYPEQLSLVVNKAVELYKLTMEHEHLSNEMNYSNEQISVINQNKQNALENQYLFERIICSTKGSMRARLDEAAQIALYDVSVMITGESGTGKELLARAMHYNSRRKDQHFVIENCGAMQEDLLCSELFGHKKGAFTGAVNDHIGLFEKANGGTIFLDEIGETSPGFQVKLLRVLQEGEIRPLGSNQSKKVDVRVISATNRNLKQDIKDRRFRADLYYRLTTMNLFIEPLRERPEDIEVIANHLLDKYSNQFGIQNATFTTGLMKKLLQYSWPGNVREMENEIKRMLILAKSPYLSPEMLSADLLSSLQDYEPGFRIPVLSGSLKDQVEQLEKQLLLKILNKFSWNKSQAANHLGLSRVGLANKIERYSLNGQKSQ